MSKRNVTDVTNVTGVQQSTPIEQFPLLLSKLHHDNQDSCLSFAATMRMATAGEIEGIEDNPSGYGWVVTDRATALASIRKPQTTRIRNNGNR